MPVAPLHTCVCVSKRVYCTHTKATHVSCVSTSISSSTGSCKDILPHYTCTVCKLHVVARSINNLFSSVSHSCLGAAWDTKGPVPQTNYLVHKEHFCSKFSMVFHVILELGPQTLVVPVPQPLFHSPLLL